LALTVGSVSFLQKTLAAALAHMIRIVAFEYGSDVERNITN